MTFGWKRTFYVWFQSVFKCFNCVDVVFQSSVTNSRLRLLPPPPPPTLLIFVLSTRFRYVHGCCGSVANDFQIHVCMQGPYPTITLLLNSQNRFNTDRLHVHVVLKPKCFNNMALDIPSIPIRVCDRIAVWFTAATSWNENFPIFQNVIWIFLHMTSLFCMFKDFVAASLTIVH